MKVCSRCAARFDSSSWRCSRCGTEPVELDGFPCFAPDLAGAEADYPAEVYERLARAEPRHFWFRGRNALLLWAFARFFADTRRFLEVGCGTGFVLSGVREAFPGWKLTATDTLTAGLRQARRRLPEADLLQVDARHMPWDQEFDLIGAFDVIEHIEEDELALREVFRALKPGGGLALTVPQHPSLWSAFDEQSHHKRRYTRRELIGKVEAAGFQVGRATSFVSLLMPALWLQRRRLASEGGDPLASLEVRPLTNHALGLALTAERWLIRCGADLPAGGSLLLLARRPPA